MKRKFIAIILAGGRGKRMGTAVSKQYLLIEDKPVLYYSLKAFEESNVDEIIIVAEKGTEDYCKINIVDKYNIKKVSSIIEGGAERYNSVHNALNAIIPSKDKTYVLIHDGARALITKEVINDIISNVIEKKAVIAGVPVKDTIKIVNEQGMVTATPARESLWQIQTPQAFVYEEILSAYNEAISKKLPGITDDSMVMEASGIRKVEVVMGSYGNIKITTPEDLAYAENIIVNNK